MRLRVASKDLVICAELVVDLDIPACSVGTIFCRRDQVLMGTKLVNEPRSGIGWGERVVRKEIICDRIKPAFRNYISRERIADPGPVFLPHRNRIINSIADLRPRRIIEIEVSIEHVRTWNVADERL